MDQYEYRIEHTTYNNGDEVFTPQGKLINSSEFLNICKDELGTVYLDKSVKYSYSTIKKAEDKIKEHIEEIKIKYGSQIKSTKYIPYII